MTARELVEGLMNLPPDTEIRISSPQVTRSDFDVKLDVIHLDEERRNVAHLIVEPVN